MRLEKVSYEYPSPADSLKRKQAWGSYSTGGSRGIRTSEQYVRKGGAAARIMLVQAAANQWNVPVSECVAKDSVITHSIWTQNDFWKSIRCRFPVRSTKRNHPQRS